jgi:hypothetical protein
MPLTCGGEAQRLKDGAASADASRGIPLSARRLLVLVVVAALAAAATAQAVAAPRAKPAPAKKRKAAKKTRAIKLSGGVAWVPPTIVNAARPPLAGTTTSAGGTAAGGGAAPAGDGPPSGGQTTTSPTLPIDPPTQQALGVTVDERSGYTMVLSRTRLATGSVVVQLINNGADAHNLRIVRIDPSGGAPADLPETPKQSQTTRTLTLGPGSYYLFCTLTTPVSHEQAGMHATLRIDP